MNKNMAIMSALLFLVFTSCNKADQHLCPTNEVVYVFPFKAQVEIEQLECNYLIQDDIYDWMNHNFQRISRPLSLKRKHEIGKIIHKEVASQGIVEGHPDLEKLNNIVDQMEQLIDSNNYYKAYILDSRAINAFTHIGGYIYLTTGLLETFDTDAIVFFIGHEIGHHLNGSCDEMAQVIDALLRNKKSFEGNESFIGKVKYEVNRNTLSVYRNANVFLSKPGEIEADLIGLYFCGSLGYDPHLALDVMNKLKSQEKLPDGSFVEIELSELIRTHPYWLHRHECAEDYIASAKIDIECNCDTKMKVGLLLKSEVLRQYPSPYAEEIKTISAESTVHVGCEFVNEAYNHTEYDEWLYIAFEGHKGWIAEKYVKTH